MSEDLRCKNRKVLVVTLSCVAGMVALAFASVPLYRLVCKVTGWEGTTRVVAENPHAPLEGRKITVRFDANSARDMPWHFRPETPPVELSAGADGFASFLAENGSEEAVTGTAVYNVTPLKAGKYFYKTQCFCFGEQTLAAGEKVHMPVTFFVDPAIAYDPEMRDVDTITLSYTFFRKDSEGLEKAMENFYNQPGDTLAKTAAN